MCAVLFVACSAGGGAKTLPVELLPGLCPPIGFGGGDAWATTCDGGTVVNVETGERRELQCLAESTRADVSGIFAMRSDAVVVYFCDNPAAPRTMIQSLVGQPDAPAVWMGLAGTSAAAIAYSAVGDAIVMISGKCKGLLVYRFESSTDSLQGYATPVADILIDGERYELDGGRGFGDAPPCSDLSAVLGFGTSADGASVALALARPERQFVDARAADVFVGEIQFEDGDGELTLKGTMTSVADDVDGLFPSIGVTICDDEPTLVVSSDGALLVLTDGKVKNLPLPPSTRWGDLALSPDGRSLLVLTEVDFEPGDLYRSEHLELC